MATSVYRAIRVTMRLGKLSGGGEVPVYESRLCYFSKPDANPKSLVAVHECILSTGSTVKECLEALDLNIAGISALPLGVEGVEVWSGK